MESFDPNPVLDNQRETPVASEPAPSAPGLKKSWLASGCYCYWACYVADFW